MEDEPEAFFWMTGEYRLWTVKSSSVVPLVTATSDPASIGALGDPSTAVLMGGPGGSIHYPLLSGGYFAAGITGTLFSAEFAGLFTEQQDKHFAVATPGGVGAPTLAVPVFAVAPFGVNPAGETSFNNGSAPMRIDVSTRIHFFGGEANGLLELYNRRELHIGLIGGFRYFGLHESFDLDTVSTDTARFGSVTTHDGVDTENNFYGGQFGVRSSLVCGPFSLDVVSKLALGDVRQEVHNAGFTSVTNGGFGLPTGNFPAGIFNMPSNSGWHHRDVFGYLPEADIRVGYFFTENLRGTIGYNVLYLSNVARASTQVDRIINPSQNPLLSGAATVSGPLAPAASFQRTEFWAHGLMVGLELRF
jgi:hypothetical protein